MPGHSVRAVLTGSVLIRSSPFWKFAVSVTRDADPLAKEMPGLGSDFLIQRTLTLGEKTPKLLPCGANGPGHCGLSVLF